MGIHTQACAKSLAAGGSPAGRRSRGRAVLLWPLLLAAVAGTVQAEISPARQSELKHLLEQDCGSCHGMTLNGGLGPALTVQALKDKPPAMLTATILEGRAGTPMPPWRDFVSAEEAAWLVQYLQQGGGR